MIAKRDKKGSHIEIIISFIIFITFLFFIFTVIEPSLNTQRGKENSLNDVEVGVINLVSSDVKSVSVKLDNGGVNCVELTDLISNSGIGNNIIIKDASNNNPASNYNLNSIQINRANPTDIFFKIYYSEEFNELGMGLVCAPIAYQLGLTKTEKYVFESKVLNLINNYSNYTTLRMTLKIPEDVEFGYGLKLENGTIIETKQQNVSTGIYVKETPIKYIDLEGNILMGYIRTKVW